MPGLNCTIIVANELDDRFDGVFAGLTLGHVAGTTRISGVLIDRSELEGLLRQLLDLGLEILLLSTSHAEA